VPAPGAEDSLSGVALPVPGRRPVCFYAVSADGGGARVKVEAPRRAVTLDEVRAHRDAIKRLGERFGVRNIRVFGSVARGEATPDSDLDLFVDVDRGHGYFDMAGFALGVEDELGVMTQVATPGGLKLRIRDRVLREAVAL
jgi:predicted nucleotidyltransferase